MIFWNKRTINKLLKLKRGGMTNIEIAEKLGTSRQAVKGKLGRLRKKVDARAKKDGHITVRANKCIVISDLHIPRVNMKAIDNACRAGKRYHITTLILGGDVFDFDSFSRFDRVTKSDLAAEIAMAKDIFVRLRKQFKQIYVVTGNHDTRIARLLLFDIGFAGFMKSININAIVTNNSWLKLISGGKEFIVAHASAYSSIAGRVANNLAHRKNTNILIGHSHNANVTVTPNGKFVAIDLGMCGDPTQFTYKTSRVNAFPEWQNAYAIVINGLVRLVIDGLTF